MTVQKCGILAFKIQMHHELGAVGRSGAVNYYYATALWKCLYRSKPLVNYSNAKLTPMVAHFSFLSCFVFTSINIKVTNQKFIQKRVFSFTFWFIKCLTKEMVELALLSKAWHSQRKYSTILNMFSVNIISQKLPDSQLMKISLSCFGFFSSSGGVTIAHWRDITIDL